MLSLLLVHLLLGDNGTMVIMWIYSDRITYFLLMIVTAQFRWQPKRRCRTEGSKGGGRKEGSRSQVSLAGLCLVASKIHFERFTFNKPGSLKVVLVKTPTQGVTECQNTYALLVLRCTWKWWITVERSCAAVDLF